ncbi:hypothetical protein PHET_03717 [Paragonimus heterotremus]|uniref:Disease resistance R13L4/SHOC-2-like LRR domain-containing protein n=1 Tax=Paragonimus heterotremus TaxID=100268 RepID=A0A8J4WSG7_9TREM|nr:hypothetical protein PHET_03717 [Paragonimus heterotremus]
MTCGSLRLYIETDDPEYPGLIKLKLQGKDLENIPAELFMLKELQVLCMSPERQPSLTYKLNELPADIGYLTHLRVLLLDTNELQSLPPEIGSLKLLEKLSVSNNRLKQLPFALSELKRLESLHLSNNLRTFKQTPPMPGPKIITSRTVLIHINGHNSLT